MLRWVRRERRALATVIDAAERLGLWSIRPAPLARPTAEERQRILETFKLDRLVFPPGRAPELKPADIQRVIEGGMTLLYKYADATRASWRFSLFSLARVALAPITSELDFAADDHGGVALVFSSTDPGHTLVCELGAMLARQGHAIHSCARPGCGRLFVAAGRGRWCSDRCGWIVRGKQRKPRASRRRKPRL